jgi:transposase
MRTRPRKSTPRRAALMFAGSMAASRTISSASAHRVVDGINNPTLRQGHVRCRERLGGVLKFYHREAA